MHRRALLLQLSEYSTRHPDELETISRFIGFVESEIDCFQRTHPTGHITGSAWVINPDGDEVLLTHHRKLNRWLQLGGHADGDPDVLSVAIKEAEEESGLSGFTHIGSGIFDIDIHPIPPRKNEPAHLHYDIRYILRPTGSLVFTVSEESHDLRWVPIPSVETLTQEPSMIRMVNKYRAQKSP